MQSNGGTFHLAGVMSEIEATAKQALEHHHRGEPAQAERLYREVLQTEPRHADVNHNLGILLMQTGKPGAGLPHLKAALEINAANGRYWLSYAEGLLATGNVPEASAIIDEAKRRGLRGAEVDALQQRTAAGLSRGPEQSEVDCLVGLFSANRHAEAEALARRMTQVLPHHGFGWKALGAALVAQRLTAEALPVLQRALALLPSDADTYNNLGNAWMECGRLTEAEASYRSAVELRPDFPQAHNNLANALSSLGRFSEAEASYRRALELKPDLHEAYSNLGQTLSGLGRFAEAEASHRRALELNPDFELAHCNLGNVLQVLGRISDATASYRRALELRPDGHGVHTNIIYTLDLLEGCGVEAQQAERRRWYAQHAKRFAESVRTHENLPDPARRLRIGYVSADFRNHPANYAFGPIIRLHDRSAFEVICYSGVTREDETTARLRQAAEGWRSTLGVSDEALAEQIRSDRIDILVDLSAHQAGNRLLVFARKPAPVQITAWGYPNGTGLETMDYFLADSIVVPREERSFYAEEVIDLPCFICYEPPKYLPEVSPLPALAGKPFTFGCINRIQKISDGAIALWGRILTALPEAQLLVKGQALDDATHRVRFLDRLRAAGIGAERVRLIGSSSHAGLLDVYREVDLGLDPFPHGGGISTAEPLWMGVPVVTLQGDAFMSRIGASILTALQMPEWIARSDHEYLRIAVEAARDLPRLARTREQLRSRAAGSIFGDVRRYTGVVEAVYRSLWRRWCAGRTNSKIV